MNIHGFDDHRDKRQQSLPFRTSPVQKRWSDPTMGSAMMHEPERPNMPVDTDMMVDDVSCVHSSGPSHLNPAAVDISGRMPTPIHASFAAQIRGNNWQPPNQNGGSLSESPLAHPQFQTSSDHDPSVPRSLEDAHEWTIVQNRRLPSPISESGGEDAAPRSPGMILDSSIPADAQRPYLPHMPHSTNPAAVGLLHPNIESKSHTLAPCPESDDMMDAEGNSTSAPSSPSPGRKIGHCRSKHTLNSWTLQPGMKKSFSIGYRTDCEKCRLKIPGHFNHIIVS